MAIPKIKKQNVLDALKYIDQNGVPVQNQSTKYELVMEDGKKYPPKYVIGVAAHLANGTDISVEGFNAVEAKNFLQGQGFMIDTKQVKYELTITADSVVSTDDRFTMGNLSLGDNYKPLDTYFKKADDTIIKRSYSKGERRNSNQTMPRIACQVFERQLASLSVEDKETFPIAKYNPNSEMIRGIYSSVDEFKKHRNTIEYLTYAYIESEFFSPDAGNTQFWACRITESPIPSPLVAPRKWITEIGFEYGEENPAIFSCVVSYVDRAGFIGPYQSTPSPSVPNLIRNIISDPRMIMKE